MCFVIFNLSRSPVLRLGGALALDLKRDFLLLVLSLYSFGVETDLAGARTRIPFLIVEICCWFLAGSSE
jgi:hypothetical protein